MNNFTLLITGKGWTLLFCAYCALIVEEGVRGGFTQFNVTDLQTTFKVMINWGCWFLFLFTQTSGMQIRTHLKDITEIKISNSLDEAKFKS